MNKTEFLSMLRNKLGLLPQSDIERSLSFYSEMIDDRMEEGMSEQEAVAAIGNIDEIVKEILLDKPLSTLMKETINPKRNMGTWQILLIIIGFPFWFPILVSFFAVILSIFITIWAVIISLYAAVAALVLGGVAGCIGSVSIVALSFPSALGGFGGSLICIGLGIFAFMIVNQLSIQLIRLTEFLGRKVKSLFIKRREIR